MAIYDPVGAIALAICEEVDCTPRQLDYWARAGVFGPVIAQPVGSGTKRPWSKSHAETAWACARLADLGIDVAALPGLTEPVRARPIDPDGELLVILTEGPLHSRNRRDYGAFKALRLGHWCARPDELGRVAAVVSLRSFAAVVPTDDSDLPSGAPPAGTEDGRHRSVAVPANHS